MLIIINCLVNILNIMGDSYTSILLIFKSTSLIPGETMYKIWIFVPSFIDLIGDKPFPRWRQKNRNSERMGDRDHEDKMEDRLCHGCKIDRYENEDLLFLWLSRVVSKVI